MSIKVEPFTVGDFIHAYNRGNNKEPIFSDKSDYWRFLRELRFFNDERDIDKFANGLTGLIITQKKLKEESLKGLDPFNDLKGSNPLRSPLRSFGGRNTFYWQEEWGKQQPLVQIIAYCLMPNHYHLILKEIIPGGISKFMKKISAGYTVYRNTKNKKVGRVFQGQYRGKRIDDEKYLQYLDAYVQLFNPFELFDGGIKAALDDFDNAFQFAIDYPFCSLGEVYGNMDLKIVDRGCLDNVFKDIDSYKEFCRDALIVRQTREFLGKLTIE